MTSRSRWRRFRRTSGPTPALTTAIPEPQADAEARSAWRGRSSRSRCRDGGIGAWGDAVFPPALQTTSKRRGSLSCHLRGGILRRSCRALLSAGPLAVSPDGRQVAFVAQNATGGTLIWVRSLDTLAAKGLAGTEGGVSPFWSPDSRSLGFFAGEKLKRIDVSGGPPITLCDASPGISGTWSPDGVIVFSPAGGTVLQKVSAAGGVPTAATAFQGEETAHARPAFLPDGRHFVYRAIPDPTEPSRAGLRRVAGLDRRRTKLMDDG